MSPFAVNFLSFFMFANPSYVTPATLNFRMPFPNSISSMFGLL